LTTSPRPGSEVALVDANVLFPHHPRNVLVTLAVEGAFEMRWTGAIEQEWTNALLREQPHLRREAVLSTALKMKEALPNADVIGYEGLEANFPKTDPKDRHVAAAAARCAPSTLVTWNKRDFDKEELSQHGVRLADPDIFLCRLFDDEPDLVFGATQTAFEYLKRPAGRPTWEEYLDLLGDKNHLDRFAMRLRKFGLRDEPTEPENGNDVAP
jgi:hypothetical protein